VFFSFFFWRFKVAGKAKTRKKKKKNKGCVRFMRGRGKDLFFSLFFQFSMQSLKFLVLGLPSFFLDVSLFFCSSTVHGCFVVLYKLCIFILLHFLKPLSRFSVFPPCIVRKLELYHPIHN
jgi:hypothetical protein